MFQYYRFFDKKEYAQAFLRGEIFMNYIGSYWESEDEERRDILEGVSHFTPISQIEILPDDFREAFKDCSLGEIPIATSYINNLSFTKVFVDDVSKIYLPFTCDFKGFGPYAVRIKDMGEFLRRLFSHFKAQHDIAIAGHIGLYRIPSFQTKQLSLFFKNEAFGHQNEWRILCVHNPIEIGKSIDRSLGKPMRAEGKPYVLSIGSIGDIAELYGTDQLFTALPTIYSGYHPYTKEELLSAPFANGVLRRIEKEERAYFANTDCNDPQKLSEYLFLLSRGLTRQLLPV